MAGAFLGTRLDDAGSPLSSTPLSRPFDEGHRGCFGTYRLHASRLHMRADRSTGRSR